MSGRSAPPGFKHLRQGWWPTEAPARVLLSAALAVGVLIPLGLAILTGSIGIPHNDAWSHALIARTFAETGHFELVGWNRSSLVGQVVILGPWGGSLVVQQVWVALMAATGLLATQRLVASRSHAVAGASAALTVAVIPEFGLLATSYMADMPAFVAVILAATIADTALATRRQGGLALALAVGLWGVTIREQALIAPAAIGLAALWVFKGRSRLWAFAQTFLAGLVFMAFELWRRSLPAGDAPTFDPSLWGPIYGAAGGLVTLSLFASPVILSCGIDRTRHRWVTALAFLIGGGVAAAWVSGQGPGALLGNYITMAGAYPQASIGSRAVVPGALWGLAMVLVVITAGWLTAVVVNRLVRSLGEHPPIPPNRFRGDVLAPLMLILLLGGTLMQSAVGQGIFSRYLLTAVPLTAALLAPLWSRLSRLGWMAVVMNLLLGTLLTTDALAYDAARWRAAESLVADGVPANSINAGLEWVGSHAKLPAQQGMGDREGSASPWLLGMFPESPECYVISGDPSIGLTPVAEHSYRRWAVAGEGKIFVYAQRPCR